MIRRRAAEFPDHFESLLNIYEKKRFLAAGKRLLQDVGHLLVAEEICTILTIKSTRWHSAGADVYGAFDREGYGLFVSLSFSPGLPSDREDGVSCLIQQRTIHARDGKFIKYQIDGDNVFVSPISEESVREACLQAFAVHPAALPVITRAPRGPRAVRP